MNALLQLIAWGVICVLVVVLQRIARFYEITSGRRSRYRWFGVPLILLAAVAVTDVLARLQNALSDRYRVDREIGAGGMATVYLAEDVRHHRQVALKVLRPELAATLGAERFHREVQIAAKLQHPHILPLLDSGEANGLLFYAMPYVEGESLRQRLVREKQLPLDDALQVAREVADALSYAHGRGLIHRDIKPENILLQSGHAVVSYLRGPRTLMM